MKMNEDQARRLARNADYWRKREDEALKHYIKEEAEYDRRIQQIYQDQLDAIEREINAFYGRYAAKEGITIAEARKRVTQADIRAYERKAKRYVEAAARDRAVNGKTDKQGFYFSKRANDEMRLYNATMRINRLEMLKANIGLEMVKGHAELESFMGDILNDRTMEEIERRSGILGKTVRINAKNANAIPNASFHHANFSDRIWSYQSAMKADLSKLLESGLIRGKNARELARDLKKYIGDSGSGATYKAERLMRTELARVQIEAQCQSYRRNGIDYFEIISNSGCCDVCKALDGKVYKVSDMNAGENAPPFHAHCRCSTAPWVDSAEYEAWLDYVSKGGTTKTWEKAKRVLENSENKNIINLGTQYFARIAEEKLTQYALNPEKDEDKARTFKMALGYDLNNYGDLIKNIYNHIDERKFVQKGDSGYGMRYEYIIRITGANGKTANVLTAWIQDGNEKRLTSLYVTNRKETE